MTAAEGPPARAPAPPVEYRLMAADPMTKSMAQARKVAALKARLIRKPTGPVAALFLLGSCTVAGRHPFQS